MGQGPSGVDRPLQPLPHRLHPVPGRADDRMEDLHRRCRRRFGLVRWLGLHASKCSGRQQVAFESVTVAVDGCGDLGANYQNHVVNCKTRFLLATYSCSH